MKIIKSSNSNGTYFWSNIRDNWSNDLNRRKGINVVFFFTVPSVNTMYPEIISCQ